MEGEFYEEYEIEYQDNTVAADNESSDISVDVQEQSEIVFEEVEETDIVSADDSSDSSSTGISLESDNTEMELETLLRDYLSTRSADASSESSSGEASTGSSEEIFIDYTDILNDLYDVTSDNASYSSSIYNYLEYYDTNNNLQSDINDISLSNTLLLFVFIGILFGAVIDFGRRIF